MISEERAIEWAAESQPTKSLANNLRISILRCYNNMEKLDNSIDEPGIWWLKELQIDLNAYLLHIVGKKAP